ncbi:MAG TPA: sensor histidine kinase [Lachnospiraceae bacterium]|nr:sensor histidine kinase [Lachnospiraceae bacterium]
MNLRQKFFLFIAVIAIIPLLVLSSYAYARYVDTINGQIGEISQNIFESAQTVAENKLTVLTNAIGLLTFHSDNSSGINSNMINILQDYRKPGTRHTAYEILQANQQLSDAYSNVLYTYDFIYSFQIFTPSGITLSYSNSQKGDLIPDYNPEENQWFKDTKSKNGSLYISTLGVHNDIFNSSTPSVFLAQSLYDVYTREYLGVFMINCSPEIFDLSEANTLPESNYLSIQNTTTGDLLYANYDTTKASLIGALSNKNIRTEYLKIPELRLSSVTDYDSLYQSYHITLYMMLLISACCLGAALIAAYFLSEYLTRPIIHLSHKMAAQDGSHLELSSQYQSRTDEIGALYNEYNSMVSELNASVKRDYENKLISMDAQMKALEARINSHFLFNTLESINSIAEIEGNERIGTMSLALGNMFRYSIKTESELVTVEDELSNVNDYVSIQSIRFDNRFQLLLEVPEEVRKQRILKLILQPLVENALYHGLGYCSCGDRIHIDGQLESDVFYLTVSDNGKGMTQEQLSALRSSLAEEAQFTELGNRNKQSIGMKNIETRIELYYGKGYGLAVDSTEGSGTFIRVNLPVIQK